MSRAELEYEEMSRSDGRVIYKLTKNKPLARTECDIVKNAIKDADFL